MSYLPRRTRTTFNLLQSYGKLTQPTVPQTTPPTTDAVAKTNIFHTDFEHDKYITSRVFLLAGLSFDHNYSQGLNFAQLYGGGIGWTAILTPTQELDLRTDVHYQRQNFIGTHSERGPHRSRASAQPTAAHFRTSFSSPAAEPTSSQRNNLNAYSAIGAAGLALPVYHRFSLSLNVLNTYLNNPAIGFKRNSFQFITGVTYTLH